MEGSERDSTEDWLLPAAATPPTIGELESKVEAALATARASEQAARSSSAAAVDAAGQARRAAELAERASAVALEAARPVDLPELEDPALRRLIERADRVMERLRAIERGRIPARG